MTCRILQYHDGISKKIVKELEFIPGKTIAHYVKQTGLEGGVRIYFNNLEIGPKRHDFEVFPKDFLTIEPLVADPVTISILTTIAISAAVGVGTMLIMNLLFPIEGPTDENELPLFKITDGKNAIRKGASLPLIVGTHKIAPDLSSKHFTEIYDDDSYFNGIYNFGINETLEVSQLKIGQTLFTNYADLEHEMQYDGGQILLFPGNVESTAGVLLNTPAATHTITSALNTTKLIVDLEFLTVEYNSKGKLKGGDLDFTVEYSPTGAGSWSDLTGLGAGSHNYHGRGAVPQPKSYKIDVTKGQYDVRVTLDSAQNDSKHKEELRFVQLRSYEPDVGDYEGQNRMALRAKSSSILQGTLNQISGIGEGSCESWNGSAWVVTKNSNPAWWYRHLLLGYKDNAGVLIYGGGLDTSEIDEAEIKLWGAFCTANSLECNYVFGNKTPLSEALALIAKCGRGKSIRKNGKASATWDRAGRPILALFNKSNIVQGSVGVTWAAKSQTDRLVAKFVNENKDFSEDTIETNLPGVTNPLTIQEITLPGVTNVTQAGKALSLESKYQSSGSRNLSFETAVEGSLRSVGEVIAVNHPLLDEAPGGRCVSIDGTGLILTLDRPVTVTGADSIRVRLPSGTIHWVGVSAATDSTVLTLASSIGTDVTDAVWNISYTDSFKIVKIEYTDNTATKIRIHCINEDSSYYTAENDAYDYDNKSALTVFTPGSGSISFEEEPIFGNTGRTDQSTITARWYGAEDSEYNVRYRFTPSLAKEGTLYSLDTRSRAIQLIGDVGDTLELYVTPFNFPHLQFSSTYVLTGANSLSVDSEPSDITGLKVQSTGSTTAFDTKDLAVEWDTPADNDVIVKYRVAVYDITGTAALLRTVEVTDTAYVYSWDQNFEDMSGDPTRNLRVDVLGISFENTTSLTAATLSVSNAQHAAITSISDAGFDMINIDVTSVPEADAKGYFVWMSETSGFTPSGMVPGTGNCVYKGMNGSLVIPNLPDSTTQYYKIAAYDEFKEPTAPTDMNTGTQATQATVAPLSFNPKTFITNGLTLTPNSPSTNKIAWPAASIIVTQGGTSTTYSISASNFTWTSGDLYLYYKEGNTWLNSTTTLATAVASDQHIIAIYKGGKKISQTDGGDPIIDGANIYAGTVGASQVVTSGLITASAQINNAIIGNAHITALNGSKITTATLNATSLIANTITSNKIGAQQIKVGNMAANSITAANASLATASVETLKVAGNAITANGSTALASETSAWSANWGTSWSAWTNIVSITVNAGVSGAVVDAFLVLSSSWVMRVLTYGGSNSGNISVDLRVVHSSGSPVSAIMSPVSNIFVQNGSNNYYFDCPSIQVAPANTASGNVTYRLQLRTLKVTGGSIGGTIYAPAGTNIYMGGTKR